MSALTNSPVWRTLTKHRAALAPLTLRQLFAEDPTRFDRFSASAGPFFLDYSKNLITVETLDLLLNLARQANLPQAIQKMFAGDLINRTEHRAVLHVALRAGQDAPPLKVQGQDIRAEVQQVLKRMEIFVNQVRSGDSGAATVVSPSPMWSISALGAPIWGRHRSWPPFLPIVRVHGSITSPMWTAHI